MHGSKVTHTIWRICTRCSTWMVWPIGLGSLPLFTHALVVGEADGHGNYFAIVRLTSTSTGLPGCGWCEVIALPLWTCVLSVSGTWRLPLESMNYSTQMCV